MKKYSIYLVLFAAWASSCTDMNECRNDLPLGNPSDYVVTGTVAGTGISARMADVDSEDDSGIYTGTQTTFQAGDPILIGWSGNTATYTYTYSGEGGVFTPKTDAFATNYGLWKELVASTATDVYAWYGQVETALPTANSEISVQSNQTLESGYLKSLRLAAHASVTPATCKALNFDFKHLMACLRIHLVIDDREVTSTDIMGSSAILAGVKTKGKISIDASGKDYQLAVVNGTTEDVKMYKCPWSEKNPYWIDFKCLLPAQTLPKDQKITVTLANGKKYNCTLSEDVALEVGKVTSLTLELKAKGGLSVFVPICTVLDATNCAFSGNRIISAIQQDGGGIRFRVYDKKPDGTWGEGELVYEDENGSAEFPTRHTQYSYTQTDTPGMSLYGDYAAFGYGGMRTNAAKTFFIKKSQNTGKWYCSDGPIGFCGYAVAISDRFLITGNHIEATNGSDTYVYPIDENGNLGTGYIRYGMSGYKLSLAENFLATNNGAFLYNESTGQWDKLYDAKKGNTQRIATDGKRMIIQDGGGESYVDIYDLNGNAEAWEGTKAKAGTGVPVGIYENYALTGADQGVNISYRQRMENGEYKWKIINPEGGFLEMMKHWDSSITTTKLAGNLVFMKGTRVLIVSDKKAYFVENIDKMVEDWINNPY